MTYLLAGIGISIVAVAIAWRTVGRLRVRRAVRHSLSHGSPVVRRTAIQALGVQGLVPYAGDLLELVSWETDPEVLGVLVETVNRSQWESSVTRELFALRMWAARYDQAPPNASLGDPAAPSIELDLREEAGELHLFRRDDAIPIPETESYAPRAEIISVDELRERRQKWA